MLSILNCQFAQGDLDPQMLQHAITISDECMDEDLCIALFEDGNEDGDFEELDDYSFPRLWQNLLQQILILRHIWQSY